MPRLVVLLLLAFATPATADGFYFTESIGGSDIKGPLARYIPSAFHARIALGMRSGAWAIESHFGLHESLDDAPTADDPYHHNALATYGIDLKYIQPLVDKHLEVYLRGGVRYGVMDDDSEIDSFAGRGLGGGAGIQLKGKIRALGFLCFPFFFLKLGPKITGSLYLDASYSFFRLHRDGDLDAPGIDARITTLSGGFAVGSDF